jgi:rRNA-processing protein FCF1
MEGGRRLGDAPGPAKALRRAARAGADDILLDTNALFLPFRERIPLEPELARLAPGRRPVVPRTVLQELDRLARERRPGAALARRMAERFPAVAAPGRGDAAVLALARRTGAWVVTSDRKLAEELTLSGVTVLRPRGRARLSVEAGRPARPPGAREARVMKRPPLEPSSPTATA